MRKLWFRESKLHRVTQLVNSRAQICIQDSSFQQGEYQGSQELHLMYSFYLEFKIINGWMISSSSADNRSKGTEGMKYVGMNIRPRYGTHPEKQVET